MKNRCWVFASLALISACTTAVPQNQTTAISSPVALVWQKRPDLRSTTHTVEIMQRFNRVEAPDQAEVWVTESHLLDDSVKAIRMRYTFQYQQNTWQQVDLEAEYLCHRGEQQTEFKAKTCL